MLVLTSSMNDPDWPDALDRETGVFTYYGDNKKPGRELHDTGRDGNLILQKIFAAARSGQEPRREVPPIFVFAGTASWRDMNFLGLGVAGASDFDSLGGTSSRLANSRRQAISELPRQFTILDAPVISRAWIDSLIAGKPDDCYCTGRVANMGRNRPPPRTDGYTLSGVS